MRVEEVCRGAGVTLCWRPFLLGPIFADQGWSTSPFNLYPAKGAYMWRDLERRALQRGLPSIRQPTPFPQNGLLAARVATVGVSEPWVPGFVRSVFRAEFAEGADISAEPVIGGILDRLGQDPAPILAAARSDLAIKDQLRASTEAARAAGVFGAPSFVTEDGELFWGDDRLEDAINWACAEPLAE